MTCTFRTVILLVFLSLLTTCKKDNFRPVNVSYRVTITDSNTVRITYNSDYYYATGIRKPIEFTSTGLSWQASHLATREEEYFISVEYIHERKPETHYKVKVIFNDTLVVDSAFYTHAVPKVELRGLVTSQ
jgi:YbbR domain-containing protein